MRKLKLRWILPLLQVALALFLLVPSGVPEKPAPISRSICLGLSAPAMFFIYAYPTLWGESFDFLPRSIGGRDTRDLFLLVGIAVVWYLVGRAIDRRLSRDRKTGRSARPRRLSQVLLLAMGIYLLLIAVNELLYPRFGGPYLAIPTLVWSGTFITISGWGLMKPMLQKLQRTGRQVQS